MELKFDLLTEEQIRGINYLEILKKIGLTAKPTDFALQSSQYGERQNYPYWLGDGQLRAREVRKTPIISGREYSRHYEKLYDNLYINEKGIIQSTPDISDKKGVRPVVDYALIKDQVIGIYINHKGITEILFGEYPQRLIRNEDKLRDLESLEKYQIIPKSDKTYTDIEYPQKVFSSNKYVLTSRGVYIVEPITWYLDEKSGLAISKDILFTSEIDDKFYKSYSISEEEYEKIINGEITDKDFIAESNLNKKLNKRFSKDILISDEDLEKWLKNLRIYDGSDYSKQLEIIRFGEQIEELQRMLKEGTDINEIKKTVDCEAIMQKCLSLYHKENSHIYK